MLPNLSLFTTAQKTLIGLALLLTILCSAFAIYGAADLHTPVPWGDSWDGLVQFYLSVQDGDIAAWFGQHNEHRFIISRVLYWFDYAVFGGSLVSLFVWNFLFAALGVFLFIRIARLAICQCAPEGGPQRDLVFILTALFFTAWLYLWTQYETLAYAFNPHFFLAYVLPLLAFYLIYKDAVSPSRKTFALACIVGVLAAGSMANAIATLPFMLLYAGVMRMGARRMAVLAVLSVIVITLYMWGFKSVAGHGSVGESLARDPAGMLHFVFNYMGGPFFFFAAGEPMGHFVAPVFGAFYIGSCTVFAWRAIRVPNAHGLQLILLVFILYIGAGAFATAGGRLPMGLGTAFAPRYTTATVMAWAALLLLYMPVLFHLLKSKTGQRVVAAGFITAFVLVTAMQSTVFLEKRDWAKGRAVGGLAAEMQVRDDLYLGKIYPIPGRLLLMSEKASARNIGFFGTGDYRDIREMIGQKAGNDVGATCAGGISAVIDLPGDPDWVRVLGTFWGQKGRKDAGIYIVTPSGDIAGYGLTGMERAIPDPGEKSPMRNQWFTAYVQKQAVSDGVYLQGPSRTCRTPAINVPQ